jgi:two-component system sensor histidine kinase TctE
MIEADASLLNVVIANLLDNAFKHNPIGTAISLKLSKGAIDEVTLCVEDEGIGVRNQELPQIFDAYFRGANAVGTAGSGLGLHLVQYIATQHHGTVSATQREGGGMRFSMHLPAAQERLH